MSADPAPGGLRSQVRGLLPDAFWTLANNLAAVAGGLATVKIIGALVPTADYGRASLVLGLVALLTQLVVNPLLTAQLRLYFDHARSATTRPFLRSLEPSLLRSAAAMSGLFVLLALGYRVAGQGSYLALLVPALFLLVLTPHALALFNLLEAARRYRALALAQTLTRATPPVFLLALLLLPIGRAASVVLAQGLALGLVLALTSGRVAAALRGPEAASAPPSVREETGAATRSSAGSPQATGAVMAEHGPGRPSAAPAPSAAVEALPPAVGVPAPDPSSSAALTPAGGFGPSLYAFTLIAWVMTTSDRYLIEMTRSQAEVGIYAINYGFWAMPYLLLNGWLETFTRSRLYARAAEADWPGVRRIVLARLALAAALGVAGTLLLLIVGRPLAILFIGESYWHGMELAMLIACGHLLFCIGNSFHSLFVAVKRADVLLQVALLSAVVGVCLNLLLLPRMGILGAGVATLASCATWCLVLPWRAVPYLRRAGPAS